MNPNTVFKQTVVRCLETVLESIPKRRLHNQNRKLLSVTLRCHANTQLLNATERTKA